MLTVLQLVTKNSEEPKFIITSYFLLFTSYLIPDAPPKTRPQPRYRPY
ncbi:MAG: hypothetical protein AAFY21_17515 [Cyanobacteria bacterium J06641_2]